MKRAWPLLLLLLSVSKASALEYIDQTARFKDAPFKAAEAAGISALVSLGAVGGYPDGTFRPEQTLNRAEFLKIVLLTDDSVRISSSDAAKCFPDVEADAWFSKYVCLALKRGIIQGYPDGLFHPDRPVNYAEALKILGEIYGYTAYSEPDAPWYAMYLQAAKNHKTELPVNLSPDRALTRGQMARLAAAYRSEKEGELSYYRSAERGETVVIPVTESGSVQSEPEPDEEQQQSSSQSSEEESPVEDTTPSVATGSITIAYPSRSGVLMLGRRSGPIADAKFEPRNGDALIRIVKVTFRKEVRSLESVYLTDQNGKGLATLRLTAGQTDKEEWSAGIERANAPVLVAGSSPVLAADVLLKAIGAGGFSGELPEVEKMSVFVESVSDGQSYEIVGESTHFPRHQTAMGILDTVINVSGADGELTNFSDVQLASFVFSGTTTSVSPMRIMNVSFTPNASYGVSLANLELGGDGTTKRHPCSVSSFDDLVNCSGIPAEIGEFRGANKTLSLYGDVILGGVGSGRTLALDLVEPGAIGTEGAIRWSDGSAEFTSVPLALPVAKGTVWLIKE